MVVDAGDEQAAHRQQAIRALRFIESGAGYAAGQLANGLTPEQAQEAVLEMAAELSRSAEHLGGLAGGSRLPDVDRRGAGDVAVRAGGAAAGDRRSLGVPVGVVKNYLRQPPVKAPRRVGARCGRFRLCSCEECRARRARQFER